MAEPIPSVLHLNDTAAVLRQVTRSIRRQPIPPWKACEPEVPPSVVLLLLGEDRAGRPCLVLNKRSPYVRQPGDLCFPGGGISHKRDRLFARLLTLPGMGLRRWPEWKKWKREGTGHPEALSLYLAAGLREGVEEMGMNPFGLDFLGPLTPQRLVVFSKVIYPLAVYLRRQRRFFLNWEVEKLVTVPLSHLVQPARYARYLLSYPPDLEHRFRGRSESFLCFLTRDADGRTDILWGVTFRIILSFLTETFGWAPPDVEGLPVLNGRLSRRYLTGRYPDRKVGDGGRGRRRFVFR